MSKSNHFSIHRNGKKVMAGQWPIEPKEPDAIISVIELEFDFELFLVRVEKDPWIYIQILLRIERDPRITHEFMVEIDQIFRLKQIHLKQIETDPLEILG